MSNLKMTSCPVCDSQNESNALLCNVCGWDLAPYPLTFGGIPESYLEKERAKIKWAKEQWQKLLETERINLANVKILEEHEQQHRLNKQQIQSQQEQLQLQTKLLEQQRSDSQQESKLLMDKLEELTCNLSKVQSTVDRIEADKSMLMTEVTRYQFDNSSTYEASDRPQNYILAQEYKTLQEQYLDRLAASILNTFDDRLDILKKGDRKRKLNRIKSMLSRSILIVGQAIIKGACGTLPKPDSVTLNMVYVNICHKINFPPDSPYADAFKDEIESLLSTGLSLANGKVQYPRPEEWVEKDFSLATQEITNEVYKNFEIRDIDKAVEQDLQRTIKECLLFLRRTALADPPGLLSIEKEGAAFDSDRHEIAKGCFEESGKVLDTIYPFYLGNAIVLTKAIVWLEPEIVDWLGLSIDCKTH